MHEFSYYNLFETKGIEYIITIFFFLLLIPFWMLFKRKPRLATATVKEQVNRLVPSFLQVPAGLFYGRNHLWAYLERNGMARIGMNELLLQMTGADQLRLLKDTGEKVQKGEYFSEIVRNGKVLRLASPITGTIRVKNNQLETEPSLLHHDPYGKGWLFEVEPENWQAETQTFYMADQAVQWLKNEWTRFKDFIVLSSQNEATANLQPVLQDGGELHAQALDAMPEEVWKKFQQEFLSIE